MNSLPSGCTQLRKQQSIACLMIVSGPILNTNSRRGPIRKVTYMTPWEPSVRLKSCGIT